MNKPFLLLLLLLFTVGLIACGGETVTEVPVATAVTNPTIPPPPATATPLPPPVINVDGDTGSSDPGATEEDVPSGPITLPAWPADQFGYGIQIHGDATYGDSSNIMNVVNNQLNLDWVKVQLRWEFAQPSPDEYLWFFYDGTIDAAAQEGLYTMLSVVAAPEWTRSTFDGEKHGPPDDFNQYYDFLRTLLTRYQGKIHAVEVWNEQNLDREWIAAAGLSATDYVTLLRGAYETIKSVDPTIIVISGALAPSGGFVEDGIVKAIDDFTYLDQMIAAGLIDVTDCVGAHHNGYNLPPNVPFDQTGSLPEAQTATFRGPFDNLHPSWSFQTTLDTYAQKVQAIDPDKKLCVTEFGWATSEGYDTVATNFGFAFDNTLEEQATYIIQAYNQMHDSGYVWLSYLFNFDYGNKGNGPTDDPVLYSLIDTQGIPRPAFGAIGNMEKRR